MSVLDNKIGGVPVVFVGGGVGLLVVGALYLQSKNAGMSAASNLQAYPEIGKGGVTDSSDPLVDDGSSFQSNATWMAQSVAFLIKTGASPFTVSAALTKYLAGASITEDELELVNKAIAKFGLPPQGVQGLSEIIKNGADKVGDVATNLLPVGENYTAAQAYTIDSTASYRDQSPVFTQVAPTTTKTDSGTVGVINNNVSVNYAGQYMVSGRAVSPAEVQQLRAGGSLGAFGAETTAEIRKQLQLAGIL